MRINILSDYLKFKKIFGVNGAMIAALTQAKELSKHAEVLINSDEPCDVVLSHGCYPYTYNKMIKFKKKGIPVIIWAHQTHYDTKNAVRLSSIMTPLVKKYLRKYYSVGDLLVAPTNNSKRIIETELSDNPVKIIRNGINIKDFKRSIKDRRLFRRKWKLNKDFTLISVGMPIKRKGYPAYKRISKQMKDNKFLWVGKPAFPLLQSNKISNQENLIITGFVKKLSHAYSGSDVFLFPSNYEGQGLVILEAAANGLPIIVRNLPTYDEWLINGKNCLKASSDDEFIKHINSLKNNKKLMNKLIKESLKLATNNTIELMGKRIIKLINELI